MSNKNRPHNFVDMTGRKIGEWVVLGIDETRSKEKKGEVTFWFCKCVCGKIKSYSGKWLRNNMTKGNCGCINRKIKKEKKKVINNEPEFQQQRRIRSIYSNMKSRCLEPNSTDYARYGAVGITLCERWREGFKYFYDDMFESYVEFESINGLNSATLDRIDSTGDYEPSNCRWLTRKQQARNRKDNNPVTVRDKDYSTIMELVEDYPYLPYSVTQYRYHKGLRGEDLIAPYNGRAKPFSETRSK